MVDMALVSAAISAASSAVGLFDKIADQVERFITKQPEPSVPSQHRMTIEGEGNRIVAREHGREVWTITGVDLEKLPAAQLRHITVLEKSMEDHYAVWESVYPQLATMDGVIQKAKVEQQLGQVIKGMKKDLDGILGFIESCGMYLDDHYQHIRYLVSQYD
ncbi:MAG: hypothetical protein HC869_24830 [Rhodospirillales bacterium]|nr:hypothetical protein [Rhodospirillales bacterium]